MIAEVLSRTFLQLWLRPVERALRELMEETRDPDGRFAYAHAGLSEVLEVGLQGQPDDEGFVDANAGLDEFSFFSRGPVMSVIQSAIEQRIEEEHPDLIVSIAQTLEGDEGVEVLCDRRLQLPDQFGATTTEIFERFGPLDFRWVAEFGLAQALRAYRGKHAFNETPAGPITLADRARIVMVGDWGSGLPRAQRVAKFMRREIDRGIDEQRQVHVVHLGDVYYAGFKKEYRERFLPYWPVCTYEKATVYSWSLNGNHDMYAGGHGYFDTLLGDPRFANQESSSWFRIENDHWRIVGLDTAWDEEGFVSDARNERGLAAPQAKKLKDWAAGDERPYMLLSHHPLFSAYEKNPGTYLSEQLKPLLTAGRVKAWFWGHEHSCVVYDPVPGVLEHGRCVGHGGVPVTAVKDPPLDSPEVAWHEDRSHSQFPFPWRWAYFGFAVLDFDGPQVTVRYYDENGDPRREENFSA